MSQQELELPFYINTVAYYNIWFFKEIYYFNGTCVLQTGPTYVGLENDIILEDGEILQMYLKIIL